MSDRITVVGGGFAGVFAALAAVRAADGRAKVTLVSREPRLVLRPRLFEPAPETLHCELGDLLQTAGIDFVEGEAQALDLEGRRVRLSDGRALGWDRLVVATGSVMPRPAVAGADQAFSIDTQAEAVDFDRRLAALADLAAPVVAVVGAGFTGIELALNLRDRLQGHGGAGEALRIVLVDQAQEVGPELGPGPRPAIEQALREARVDLRLGARLSRLGPTQVVFDGGERLAADAVVLCTGLRAADFARAVPGPRDPAGRLQVDAFLGAVEAPGVFVTGDAACASPDEGRLTLMSCQHALPLGRFAGENAARSLLGLELLPYVQRRYATCLDLGRSGAVVTQGWDRVVQMLGEEAKAIKRQINERLIYPPQGSREEILKASIPA